VHERTLRGEGPFIRVNCGAIPPELIDSELFGHEKGSFTGASGQRRGWFERADAGTLFLDEVGELPPAAQVRLLRVLQDGSLHRVGGETPVQVDVRVIAATHRDLAAMVSEGGFRQDLWYRIAVFPILIPPLRERQRDIPALARHFARRASNKLGLPLQLPSPEDIERLRAYPWPGNVRELASVLERAAILGNGAGLQVATALGVPAAVVPAEQEAPPRALTAEPTRRFRTLDEAMVEHIEAALARTHGRVEGPFGAARLLGINPHTLRSRMRKLGMDPRAFRHLEVNWSDDSGHSS
jgi:transcriptional regulator with GAF, ATPase, and Fis domain